MPKVLVVEGDNDLASQNPDIASEWHPEKNGTSQPSQVFVRSSQMVWWRCSLGHEWKAKIVTRHVSGCPVCTNRRVLPGYNDLASQKPELAKEWNFSKNKDLSPTQITPGTSTAVWWVCEEGHEWKTSPANRSGLGTGCPYCSGRKRVSGTNDLLATNPELADEWHFEKNLGLDPWKISPSSSRKVWWICGEGHEFQRVIHSRAVQGVKYCPYCTAREAIEGENDLATTHLELSAQWHPTRNKGLSPNQITHRYSKGKVWWLCESGHEWQAKPWYRSVLNSGCPYCANRVRILGEENLATLYPELLSQWHTTRNLPTVPEDLTLGSGKKVWWICDLGHEWQAPVGARVQRKSGCPYCAGVLLLEGFNDLATRNPDLAKEWHPAKNHPLEPKNVSGGNHNKAWWMCEREHEWEATISSRNSGIGCPVCAGKKVLAGFNDFQTYYPQLAEEWDYDKNQKSPDEVSSSSGKLVWWICRSEGHSWRTSPSHRGKGGRGCPSCSKGGYDPNKPGVLYFLHNAGLRAKKVGITNQKIKTARLELFQSAGWSVLKTWEREDGYQIFDSETIVLRWLRKDVGLHPYLGKPEMGNMGGWSETFFEDGVEDSVVIAKVEATLSSLVHIGVQNEVKP